MDLNTKSLASRVTKKMFRRNEAPPSEEVKADRTMYFFI